jgi:hypothetical protein
MHIKKYKHYLLIITAIALSTIQVMVISFWVSNGPMKDAKFDRTTPGYLQISAPDEASVVGYIIVPGNLIDASRYSSLARTVQKKSSSTVIIMRPTLRMAASLSPQTIQKAMQDNNRIKEWHLIGHSAGASVSCKHSPQVNPKSLTVINGFCRMRSTPTKVIAVFGTKDLLVKSEESSENYNEVHFIDANHMLPTDSWRNTKEQDELALLLTKLR